MRRGLFFRVGIREAPAFGSAGDVTSLGSAIFAFLAAGTFATVEEAQDALCAGYVTVEPERASVATWGIVRALPATLLLGGTGPGIARTPAHRPFGAVLTGWDFPPANLSN